MDIYFRERILKWNCWHSEEALTLYSQIKLSSRFLRKYLYKNISCSCDFRSNHSHYKFILQLSAVKDRTFLLNISWRHLCKKYISELCCYLAFSTFNNSRLPKFCGISSSLV